MTDQSRINYRPAEGDRRVASAAPPSDRTAVTGAALASNLFIYLRRHLPPGSKDPPTAWISNRFGPSTAQGWNPSCTRASPIRVTWKNLLQEILIKTHQSLHTVRNAASIKAWLYQMANRSIIDFYRRRARGRDVERGDLWYDEDDLDVSNR